MLLPYDTFVRRTVGDAGPYSGGPIMPSPLLRPQARFGAQPAKPALSAEMGGWRVAPGEVRPQGAVAPAGQPSSVKNQRFLPPSPEGKALGGNGFPRSLCSLGMTNPVRWVRFLPHPSRLSPCHLPQRGRLLGKIKKF